jgi:hypothetical protein
VLVQGVSHAGLTYRPWNALALAAAVAITVTLLLFRLVHRTPAATG